MFPRSALSLTVFGRSVLLISLELAANVICWVVAARSHAILGLAILAWTIGLRHGLDADHIRSLDTQFSGFRLILGLSAIDNATRTLIHHGQLAVTCGLFFSLGHSTIVIVVNVAILISTSIYSKLGGVDNVGSIVGTAISGSFLFIVGLANLIILCKILRQRRKARRKRDGETDVELASNENMLMMRLLGPLVNFVNCPWKMYPVGVLFGLGFDTASSIALLAISALAKNGVNNTRSDVIILPLLFTTGMTLVDSLDSILMFYSYTGFADHSWRIFEKKSSSSISTNEPASAPVVEQTPEVTETENKTTNDARHNDDGTGQDRKVLVKRSNLSIILTTLSILLAFTLSLIEIMGLIGANCGKCQAAASAPGGGGLEGAWWRAWAKANEDYGYIGAGIVGTFLVLVIGWYTICMLF